VLASARNVGMVLGVGLAGAVFTTVQAQTASVVTAVTASFAVAIGLAVLGIVTSAIRGA
jgi:hypothetical protein